MIKAKFPSKMHLDKFNDMLEAVLEAEGRVLVSMLERPIATWKEDRPDLKYETGKRGDVSFVRAGLKGYAETGNITFGGLGDRKWYWLNNGTDVRYAKMSRDWISKTSVNSLRSDPGRGRVLARGKKAGARPGIDARDWTGIIMKARLPEFRKSVENLVKRFAGQLF